MGAPIQRSTYFCNEVAHDSFTFAAEEKRAESADISKFLFNHFGSPFDQTKKEKLTTSGNERDISVFIRHAEQVCGDSEKKSEQQSQQHPPQGEINNSVESTTAGATTDGSNRLRMDPIVRRMLERARPVPSEMDTNQRFWTEGQLRDANKEHYEVGAAAGSDSWGRQTEQLAEHEWESET